MKINTLQDLYLEELRDLYDAESQMIKVLPKLAAAASNEDLQALFGDHTEEAKQQSERLERILEDSGSKAKGKKCEGMKGIIAECEEYLNQDLESAILDVCLISCAQKMKHYEIAAYGCACAYAKALDREEESDQLEQTLDEEKDVDERLSELAETINSDAAGLGGETQEESELEEEKPKKSR